jgi:ATP-binding cassette subfamily B protein
VLDGITLTIPVGKTTAIVGTSGSGKTTLLKLILKFYQATEGKISIDTTNLKNISNKAWRRQLGTVMQDGFIFNDTIANNVAVGVERIDKQQLVNAVRLACIEELIEQLPLGFNTKIGSEGMGLSQGQKQRLLIARAMYKNPEIMLFDEATNALDATTEKNVMANINQYFENKTMVVVAHRLSTVKNAHQIIAIEGGKIVEQGNHVSLVALKGKYYELVKNQLELGE